MGLNVKIYLVLFAAVFSILFFQGHHYYAVEYNTPTKTERVYGANPGTEQNQDSGLETGTGFPFGIYITPESDVVRETAAWISGPADAYTEAVRWPYVSEKTLNGVDEKWLTPAEFLMETPDYPNNPLKGRAVGDCEEKANTLVSILRAVGVSPEDVRVVLGKVKFNGKNLGHVWVEFLTEENWLVLDPTCGPYWDDEDSKLVYRSGLPFDYYSGNDYPVLDIWAYYNDVFCLDLQQNTGNAPDYWR